MEFCFHCFHCWVFSTTGSYSPADLDPKRAELPDININTGSFWRQSRHISERLLDFVQDCFVIFTHFCAFYWKHEWVYFLWYFSIIWRKVPRTVAVPLNDVVILLWTGQTLSGTLSCKKNRKDCRSLDVIIQLADEATNTLCHQKFVIQWEDKIMDQKKTIKRDQDVLSLFTRLRRLGWEDKMMHKNRHINLFANILCGRHLRGAALNFPPGLYFCIGPLGRGRGSTDLTDITYGRNFLSVGHRQHEANNPDTCVERTVSLSFHWKCSTFDAISRFDKFVFQIFEKIFRKSCALFLTHVHLKVRLDWRFFLRF